jgi:flagellar motor protein MotB
MEWLAPLQDLPLTLGSVIVTAWIMAKHQKSTIESVTSGFNIAIKTQEKRIDDLQEELKTVKSESKTEQKELKIKIEKLESQNTNEINQKLDLILQKV